MSGTEDAGQPAMLSEGLSRLRFLLGDWDGDGISHGEAIRGRLQIRGLADGGFIEQRDYLLEEERVVHEDLVRSAASTRDCYLLFLETSMCKF